MKCVQGIWLPDGDEHFSGHLEREVAATGAAGYQTRKWVAALEFCKHRGHAVDIGAHVGLWTRPMAKAFARVTAYEPMPELAACWRLNTDGLGNVDLREGALGAAWGRIGMAAPAPNSGNAHVDPSSDIRVPIDTLDNQALGLVDFIKIDVEGFELDVVKGGEGTIRTSRPVMVVEQKPGHGARYGHSDTAAVDLLQSWGATVAWVRAGDYCLVWNQERA